MTTTDVHYEKDRQHNSSFLIIAETNINGKSVLGKKKVFSSSTFVRNIFHADINI